MGCLFNEGDHCTVYENPHEQWAKGPCEGYDNYELASEYGLANDGKGAHERKNIRKAKAKFSHTIEKEETHNKFKKLKWP